MLDLCHLRPAEWRHKVLSGLPLGSLILECQSKLRTKLLYAKVCAKREDFGDATGARTFLSAAAPEYSTGSERLRALLPFDVAADKNVRAPLWFRLRRPGVAAMQ